MNKEEIQTIVNEAVRIARLATGPLYTRESGLVAAAIIQSALSRSGYSDPGVVAEALLKK